jgi:hypothetical protein
MLMFTNGFIITAICKYDVVGHLVDNIRKFSILDYTIEEVKTAKGAGETEKGFRVTIHTDRNTYAKVMEYLKQYYVKDYGIILYYNEVFQPM